MEPSFFRCPVCGGALVRDDKTYRCPAGHSFDRAREGYVHLLPANQMRSKAPGDDKAMAAARNRFLSTGGYAPLRDALCKLVLAHTGPRPRVLDAGCGEGYYTAGVAQALRQNGREAQVAGVDLSKPSLRWAARRAPEAEFAVASVYHLPVSDSGADLVLDCFSPLALEEFQRVLAPGGAFLYVVPAAEHLWELKQVLYETPYKNPEEESPYQGFEYLDILPVETRFTARGQTLQDLFQMTPYFWKTPREGARRLAELEELEVTAAFRIHVFRRKI